MGEKRFIVLFCDTAQHRLLHYIYKTIQIMDFYTLQYFQHINLGILSDQRSVKWSDIITQFSSETNVSYICDKNTCIFKSLLHIYYVTYSS